MFYLRVRSDDCSLESEDKITKAQVFCTSPKARVNEQFEQFNDFRKSWKSARKKVGLDDFVFHDFRHVAISNLRKAGNSPTVIMKASGHKTMSMFLRYNLVDEEDLKGMRWIERNTESDTKEISAKKSA